MVSGDATGSIVERGEVAMSRLAITFEMAERIADRIATLARDAPEVGEAGALPLYLDIEGVIGIRPDGSLVAWSHDSGGREPRPVEDRLGMLIALAAGARCYPELEPLLRFRGAGKRECVCRAIPKGVSGLIVCGHCGATGWHSGGKSATFARASRPYEPPRVYSRFGLLFVALALLSFYGGFVILAGAPAAMAWRGIGLIALGVTSLVLSFRGIGRRRIGGRRPARGPAFTHDDPEVAALPPTTLTQLSEQMRRARERREAVQD